MAAAFTATSLLGLALLGAIALGSPPPTQYPNQTNLVFSLLAAIDLLGILAAVFPMECARIISPGHRKEFAQQRGEDRPSRRYEGHYPPCEKFSSHVITISKRKYCAGCTGLSLGAVSSLIGIGFLLGGLSPLPFAALLWLGFALVLPAQIQHLLLPSGVARLAISFGLAFGSFLVLAGVNGLYSSLFLDCYCLLLIVFLIVARTVVSRQTHASVCSSCGLEYCPLLN